MHEPVFSYSVLLLLFLFLLFRLTFSARILFMLFRSMLRGLVPHLLLRSKLCGLVPHLLLRSKLRGDLLLQFSHQRLHLLPIPDLGEKRLKL